MFNIPLLDRYLMATEPVIVKFHDNYLGENEIRSALWYLYSRSRKQDLANVYIGGFSGNGVAIPANRIVTIEVIGQLGSGPQTQSD